MTGKNSKEEKWQTGKATKKQKVTEKYLRQRFCGRKVLKYRSGRKKIKNIEKRDRVNENDKLKTGEARKK